MLVVDWLRSRKHVRKESRRFVTTVVGVRDLTPHMRRITLTAPEFTDFQAYAPDEFFGLLIPPQGQQFVLPKGDSGNVRQVVRDAPPEQRPTLRWYTVRRHRPEQSEVDVDFVLHGDTGPGSRWAGAAKPGDQVGFHESGAPYIPTERARRQLLIADETGLPAVFAILESLSERQRKVVEVFIEVEDEQEVHYPEGFERIHWALRKGLAPGVSLLETLRTASLPWKVEYAWACGEGGVMQRVREHLLQERGIPKRAITHSGYWFIGRERS